MSSSNDDIFENEVLCTFLNSLKRDGQVELQSVIDAMETEIVTSFVESNYQLDYKGVWLKRIHICCDIVKVKLDATKKPSWKKIDNKIQSVKSLLTPAQIITDESERVAAAEPAAATSSSSTCPSLKTRLSVSDKEEVLKIYDTLISYPETCWYLNATKQRAKAEKKEAMSVESRMRDFVSTLNYLHPALSFILDTDDLNWRDYFDAEEIKELRSYGEPVLRIIPDCMKVKFEEMERLRDALEAYNYGRNIEHHPIQEPLLAWLSQTLMQTAKFFIPGASTPVKDFLESDSLYYLWGFINTVFHNSTIEALSKEKTSTVNASMLNSKRKLSAVDGIEREKICRRIDTIYIGSGIKLGGLEIGPTGDNTEEFEDGMFKLPSVLKDMLTNIVNHRPTLLRKAHVVGYSINGSGIRLMDVDLPKGHVVRVRRVDELKYPVISKDYVFKMLSLLELAMYGKKIIDDTYALCCETRIRPSVTSEVTLVPPSFIPAENQPSFNSTSPSSRDKRSKNKSSA